LVVSKLLKTALPNYVDLGFTSEMERALDKVAEGEMDSVKYLTSIYFGDQGLKAQIERQEKAINADQSRSIQLEGLEALNFRIGKYGAYVCRKADEGEVCASLPDAQVPGDMTPELANKLIDQKINGTDALGKDPKTGLPVYVLTGRYGPYVQMGDNDSDQLKRMAIPANLVPEEIKMDQALALLELPKTLGQHPETKKDIKKGLGRFGPYVVHEGDYRSIPRTENIFAVDLKRALELFAQPKRMRGRSAPLKELGVFPDTQEQVQVHTGKYGPYIKVGGKNISLAEDMKIEDLTLDMVMPLIRDKLASGKGGKGGKAAKSKASAKKTATKVAAPEAPAKPASRTVLKKANKSSKAVKATSA
jgi:DNA topoisomerase-1